jgi:hypothetical protein
MATQKLMPERISRTEEKPLSGEDLALLKAKKNKQLIFLLSGYLPFIAFGLFILIMGPYSLNTPRRQIMGEFTKLNIDEEQKGRFWTVAPWFLGFMFILLTIYFGRLYFQSIKPLMKDIKLNKKQLFFFKPVKNPMAFFNKYYLSTPLYQNQQIEVSREDFESIHDNDELHLEVGPDSTFILRLCNGNKEIKYY